MGVRGQRHAPAALPLGKTRYPLYRRLGGLQGRSGRVRKISPPTGIRSPDRPTRRDWKYKQFLGWTYNDAAILYGGKFTCIASALTAPTHFVHEGGGSRFFRNVKNTVHSQTGQKKKAKTESIHPYKLPIACLRSSLIS